MKGRLHLGLLAALLVTFSCFSGARDKPALQRGMLVKMDSSGCGVHEKGVTGVGSIMASAGVERVTTEDKLCAEYVLRTDTMEYHIRPMDKKHPTLLAVGHESLFRVAKDRMFLRMSEQDSNKLKEYQVVSMKPLDVNDGHEKGDDSSSRSECN